MARFTDETFRSFLGEPIEAPHEWGREWRFSISQATIEQYRDTLRDTIYHHHTFFDLHKEIEELGFILSAQAMKDRYSGNPVKNDDTQKGNLGEVLGALLTRAYLNFRGQTVYPKRYNTNIEQSQKGIDILSFKDKSSPAELLFGEVKVRTSFDQSAIRKDYESLWKHQRSGDLPKKLHFARAYFHTEKENWENVDRHEMAGTPVHYLLLSITEASRSQPFNKLSEYKDEVGMISNLLAVHIEITGLNKLLPSLFA
jgi:hypothetical protein